jgi:hypothetical protein
MLMPTPDGKAEVEAAIHAGERREAVRLGDALLKGQYAFLRERIRALMELRMAHTDAQSP